MRKNSLWNRLFHHKEVKATLTSARKAKELLRNRVIITKIIQCNDLDQLLSLHKQAWNIGFQNINLGPCSCGMFRCDSIPEMTSDQVYLGGIWGLYTFNIPEWNTHRNEKYGCNGFGIREDYSLYQMIVDQYKGLLRSNLESLYNKAQETVKTARAYGYND